MSGATKSQSPSLPPNQVPAIGPLPTGSVIPISPNPHFTGRDNNLLDLARKLFVIEDKGETVLPIVAIISGIGGVGKTQLAAEFAHRYGRYFQSVQWVSMAEMNSVGGHIAACGLRMNLASNYDSLSQPQQIALVQQAWEGPEARLIIFDNCEDDGLLADWRPKTGGSRLLVTSRQGVWNPGQRIRPLRLQTLARPAGIDLLQKLSPNLSADEAGELAGELGDLPLALHLAGSYLSQYIGAVTVEDYLKELRLAGVDHDSLSAVKDGYKPTRHDLHVGRTFAISYDKIGTDPLAATILGRLACLAPGEPVPPELLSALMGEGDKAVDKKLLIDSLRHLHRLGLIETGQDRNTGGQIAYLETPVLIHRMLNSFLSRRMDLQIIRPKVEEIIANEAQKIKEAGLPTPLKKWIEHLRFVAEMAEARDSEFADWLLDRLAVHLADVGDYAEAKSLHERALKITENRFGPDHPKIAIRANNLGLVLWNLGDFIKAKAAFERALAIDMATLGSQNPGVATDLNNLGLVLYGQGDLIGAKKAFERAVAIDTAYYGAGDPKLAVRATNLGAVLQKQGDLAGAREAFERALTIETAIFGPNHPNVARNMNNLGIVLKSQGDLAGAKEAFERALAIDKAVFGPNHPNLARYMNNVALILVDQGDLAGARESYERALVITTAIFGSNHPSNAHILYNLGLLQEKERDKSSAIASLQKSLKIRKEILGSDHPETKKTLKAIAYVESLEIDNPE